MLKHINIGNTYEHCGAGYQEAYGECHNGGRDFGRGCGLEHSSAMCQMGLCCSKTG